MTTRTTVLRAFSVARQRGLLFALGFAVCLASAWTSRAGDAPAIAKDEMRQNLLLLRVDTVSAVGQRAQAERLTDPLLRYSDPARGVADGSLWAWGKTGRPLAILEIEKYPHRPDANRWLHGLVSLSPGTVACAWDDGQVWQSTKPGFVLSPFPDAPVPAASERGRLAQMKELARKRFVMREDAGPVRRKITLRLLPSPVYRYSDPSASLQDGAIFVFASGTNPEALLVLESRPGGSKTPIWHYGITRITGALVAADLDGHEVWSRTTAADPPHSGPAYVNRWLPTLSETK